MPDKIIKVDNISKQFRVGTQDIQVLKGISVEIDHGDFVIIFGPSGCGKSTFLHIVLGLEPPTDGTLNFLGKNLYETPYEDDRSDFRKKHIGMVYQQSNWVRSLTVKENVAFPLLLLGHDKPRALVKAIEMLKKVGMEGWADYMPTELSSGQQQRISLARALINDPEIIIADEPTGNLDYESGQMIMGLLADLNKQTGKTVMMVTHDLEYITFAKSVMRMFDGKLLGYYKDFDKDKLMSELRFKRGGMNTPPASAESKKSIKFTKKKDAGTNQENQKEPTPAVETITESPKEAV